MSTTRTRPRNTKPSKGDIRRYWLDLRAAADAGDIRAQAALIALVALAERRKLGLSLDEHLTGDNHE